MPIYEYRCRNGHSFEVFHSMSDDPVSSCEECGAPTERVFHPVAVHFKGSGFYTTDYARKGAAKAAGDGSKPDSGSESGSDSKPESGSKSDAAPKSDAASKSGSGEKKKAEAGKTTD